MMGMEDEVKMSIGKSKADSESHENEDKEKSNEGKKYKYKIDPSDVTIGDFHITMNKDMGKVDAIALLERMHNIRNDSSLTNEQKAAKVQKVLKDIQE